MTDAGKELAWPAGVRRYSYRKNPDLPSGNGHYNIQIAFNVVPPEKKPMLTHPAGTMPRFMCYMDTDYEFALNPVADKFGGGTEIFCLQRPGTPRKHFFPRQPKAAVDGGPVKTGKLVIRADGDGCVFRMRDPLERIAAGQAAIRRRGNDQVLVPRERGSGGLRIGRRAQRFQGQSVGLSQ